MHAPISESASGPTPNPTESRRVQTFRYLSVVQCKFELELQAAQTISTGVPDEPVRATRRALGIVTRCLVVKDRLVSSQLFEVCDWIEIFVEQPFAERELDDYAFLRLTQAWCAVTLLPPP